jgi:Homeodomain-like domain
MPGPKPRCCSFPEEFLQEARQLVRQRTARVQDVQRFRLALLLHDRPDLSSEAASELVDLSARQVQRWRSRWVRGDYSIDDLEGRGRKASFSPL